ncbi:hypothetical protein [Pseudomonas sp. MPB26]|uniref:hypothetical protein n=1 Tax=Pseudomonas sp. MPB26 TaxID=3388491 RepID=UPI0039851CF4
MYIDDAERVQKRSGDAQAESPAAFNEISDVDFFNAQLDPTAGHYKRIAPSMPDNLFNLSVSESPFRRVKRGVDDRLRNKQTEDSMALPHSLALANFAVVSRVKVLGTLVKGIDKISNMA